MTYDEFLNIPVNVFKDLKTIFLLKSKYQMDLTSEESVEIQLIQFEELK